MPVRKPATKAGKVKKKTPRKAVKVAVRSKAKTRKTAAKKAVKRTKPAARKPARPAVKARPKARAKAAAKPRTAAARKTVAARRAAKPAAKKPVAAKSKGLRKPAIGRGPLPKLVAVAPRIRRPVEPVPAEDEEGYDPDFHRNLLLGPRNVKPYVARKGEAYMGKEQLRHFRLILSNWKRDLMEEVDRTMSHMKDEAANPPDPNDRATLESEFALELRTRDRERKLIRKIDEALKRIDDASYGYCLETGEPIGIKRLEARPVATLCIEAQERRERREKQYGDRDDWYR